MSAPRLIAGSTISHRDGERLHLCSICAEWKPWGARSGWYGSYREMEDQKPIVKWCSDECADKLAFRGHHDAAEAFATGAADDADVAPVKRGRR